jgi:hypothetical protein
MKCLKTALVLISAICIHSQLTAQQPCVTFHRQLGCSQASGPGFIYNSQSKSGVFAKGTTSKLKLVVYTGFDYSVSICADPILGTQIGYIITDATTGEVLYDNATDKYPTHNEFSVEQVRNLNITVSIPGTPGVKGKDKSGCLGVLIEQRVSKKKDS